MRMERRQRRTAARFAWRQQANALRETFCRRFLRVPPDRWAVGSSAGWNVRIPCVDTWCSHDYYAITNTSDKFSDIARSTFSQLFCIQERRHPSAICLLAQLSRDTASCLFLAAGKSGRTLHSGTLRPPSCSLASVADRGSCASRCIGSC